MHSDLERVITLQRLDSAAHDAQRRLADEPARAQALDGRLEAARQRLASAKDRLAENQNARRAIEKEVAVHQGRLSKFRDQAMAVKTNQEYHAVQKEIGFAQTEIKTLEDRILERMLEADDLTSRLKRADTDLAAEQKAVDSRGSPRRHLHDLPRPPSPAGVQHGQGQRRHHAMRQLSAHSLLLAGGRVSHARQRPANSSVKQGPSVSVPQLPAVTSP